MLKACLIAPALAMLLGGPALAQAMPLPPSATEAPPAPAKPGKAKPAKKRTENTTAVGARVQRPAASTAAPLRPFDRRDIADPQSDSRIQPQLTPSGGIGMGGRF
jgi:hypothetical protein